jgi:alpha-D-ribose 1-methylphosphonate 5-triphosphate synthase subunit PhnG
MAVIKVREQRRMSMTASPEQEPAPHQDRRAAMALLAKARHDELARPLASHWPGLAVRILRQPETGLVMLRGRIGGDGAAFNLGEATMSRAVVELDTGELGYGQVLGRDTGHARLAAICDALFQREADRAQLEAECLQPIRTRLDAERARTAAETAATKVDFFTLVRGED